MTTLELNLDINKLPFKPEKMSMARLRRIKLTPNDFELAVKFQDKQRLEQITLEYLFKGSLYSILAANESYHNQMKALHRLEKAGLNTPHAILNDKERLKDIISLTNYGQQRSKRILEFCEWWQASSLPSDIIHDSMNGKEKKFVLRDQFAKEAYGVGLKTASLILNTLGYENVVPVDKWVIRYLFAHGLIDKDPTIRNRKQSGGISYGMYRKLEKMIQGRAKEIGVSPLNYQLAIWVANSRTGGNMSPQIDLNFEEKLE